MADLGNALTDPSADVATQQTFGKRPKKDFSDEVLDLIPKATGAAEQGRLREAIETLLSLEKRSRLGGDSASAGDAALAIVKLCRRANNWEELCVQVRSPRSHQRGANARGQKLALLFKRRSQFKSVQEKIVQEACEYVKDAPDQATELKLIGVLRHISEGKLFLEVEHARLTMRLAVMREQAGDIPGAADILQEEQVETYGGMNKREKNEFLLEQVRLTLGKRDYIRASILSKKVQRKVLDEPGMEDLKIRLHRLLIAFHLHERDAFQIAQSHLAIFACASVRANPALAQTELRNAALLLALAPWEAHQSDAMRRAAAEPEMQSAALLPYHRLLTKLLTPEVCDWPLPDHAVLQADPFIAADPSWLETLAARVVEHNIRTVAKYYTRITIARLATFCRLDANATEAHVCRMVTSTTPGIEPLAAKIDRPKGVISFGRKTSADATLSQLGSDVGALLDLVEATVHLIHKENMLAATKEQQGVEQV